MDLAQRDQIPGRSLASVKDVMDDRTMANGKRSLYLYGQCGEDMNTRYQGGDGLLKDPCATRYGTTPSCVSAAVLGVSRLKEMITSKPLNRSGGRQKNTLRTVTMRTATRVLNKFRNHVCTDIARKKFVAFPLPRPRPLTTSVPRHER